MTVGIEIANSRYVILASDRLISTQYGPYDPLANKVIVCVGKDGIAALSFAGRAYVSDEPTDEWMARQILGRPFQRHGDRVWAMAIGGNRTKPLTINQMMWRLQDAAGSTELKRGFQLLACGWRIRRHRLTPFHAKIFSSNGKIIRDGCLRLWPDHRTRSHSVGYPWDRAQLDSYINASPRRDRIWIDPDAASEPLVSVVRHTAARWPKVVGRDVTVIKMPRPAPDRWLIDIHYHADPVRLTAVISDGTQSFPAAFWPWIITPGQVAAPAVSNGDGFTFMSGAVEIRQHADLPPRFDGSEGLPFAYSSMTRPPKPKWSNLRVGKRLLGSASQAPFD